MSPARSQRQEAPPAARPRGPGFLITIAKLWAANVEWIFNVMDGLICGFIFCDDVLEVFFMASNFEFWLAELADSHRVPTASYGGHRHILLSFFCHTFMGKASCTAT